MGKKSRRRDKRDNKERGPPSAAENHSDEYVVRGIEGSDPSYHHFPKLLDIDPELSRMVCSGCGVARYCSEKCQREHWPWHQEVCLAIQAERRKKEEFERQIREAVERQADAPL